MVWTLKENGFRQAKALTGGFEAWEKARYPVVPKAASGKSGGRGR